LNWKLREAGGLKGIIWHDKDGDNTIDTNDDWTGDNASTCSGMSSPFKVLSNSKDIINKWVCDGWGTSTDDRWSYWVPKPKLLLGPQSFELDDRG